MSGSVPGEANFARTISRMSGSIARPMGSRPLPAIPSTPPTGGNRTIDVVNGIAYDRSHPQLTILRPMGSPATVPSSVSRESAEPWRFPQLLTGDEDGGKSVYPHGSQGPVSKISSADLDDLDRQITVVRSFNVFCTISFSSTFQPNSPVDDESTDGERSQPMEQPPSESMWDNIFLQDAWSGFHRGQRAGRPSGMRERR